MMVDEGGGTQAWNRQPLAYGRTRLRPMRDAQDTKTRATRAPIYNTQDEHRSCYLL